MHPLCIGTKKNSVVTPQTETDEKVEPPLTENILLLLCRAYGLLLPAPPNQISDLFTSAALLVH